MPNSDIGEVAGAVSSVSDLIGGMLERADRDALEKEFNENIIAIQNSFADNNLDAQYRVMYKLFSDAGYPPTPGGSVGDAERQFRHTSFLIASQLIHERKLISRLIAQRSKQ